MIGRRTRYLDMCKSSWCSCPPARLFRGDIYVAKIANKGTFRGWGVFVGHLRFFSRERRVRAQPIARLDTDRQRWTWPCLAYLPPVGVHGEISASKNLVILVVRGRGRRDRAPIPLGRRKGGLGVRSPSGVVVISGFVSATAVVGERGKIEIDSPLVVVVAVRHLVPVLVVSEKTRALVQPSVNYLAGHRDEITPSKSVACLLKRGESKTLSPERGERDRSAYVQKKTQNTCFFLRPSNNDVKCCSTSGVRNVREMRENQPYRSCRNGREHNV